MATFDIQQLQTDTTHKNPRIILKKALELFDNIVIAFSGAEDVALIDMATNIKKTFRFFP
jgi:phosphoadenosine phosphosulfate reductase